MQRMKFSRLFTWGALAALCLLASGTAWGQAVLTGTLGGTITANGEGLPGVTVEVDSPSLQGTRLTVTGVNGSYIIRGLPAGTYSVVCSLEGMNTVQGSVLIEIGNPARFDTEMQVSAVTETVEVTGSAPNALETTQISLNVTGEEIDDLPVIRGLDSIADLAPGLTLNTFNNGQITINGSWGYDSKWLINGVEVNDNVFGSFDNLYIEDAIAETQVLTSGISAEYGRFSGGVINIITKSGGNDFSGSFRASYTNPSWQDETPFEKENGIQHESKTNTAYQATLGGRVLRDRLWFFLAGRTQERSTTETFDVSGVGYNQVSDNDRFEIKLTANFNDSHSLTGSYSDNDSLVSDRPSLGITIDPNGLQDSESVNDLFVARYSGVLNSNLYLEAQASQKEQISYRGALPGDLATTSPFISYGLNLPQGVDHYNAPYFDRSDPEERNNEQLAANLSYFLSTQKAGTHDLKIGVEAFTDINIGGNSQSPTNQVFLADYAVDETGAPIYDSQGRFTPAFYSVCALLIGADPACGDLGLVGFTYRNEWLPERRSELNIDTNSLYVNDIWQLDRWSFNLGLRYEKADSTATGDVTAVDTKRLVPRLGASYDLKGDGKYRFDATWGQYVGVNSINNASLNSNVGNPSLVQWVYAGPAGSGVDFAPAFDFDNWIPVFARFPKESVLTDELEAPVTNELTFSFGMSLAQGRGFFKATYVNRDVDDIVEDFIAIENGITTITDPIMVLADNIVIANSNEPRREYEAFQVQGSYRITDNWLVNGNYTYQIRNHGNFVGENTNQPVLRSSIGNQVEFYNGRNVSFGRLPGFQKHKLRLWSSYNWDLKRFGNLIFGGVLNYDSGLPYSLAATVPITAIQLALDPGYANPPTSQTVYFGERGSQLFDSFYTVDLSVTYEVPVWQKLAPWVKFQVFNVFNDDTAISYNTAVTGDFNGPLDELGLPLNYIEGPRFGTPDSADDYVEPIEYRLAVGIRF